ncbi:MAG: oxidoreductase [Candidatus Hodarchaeales archaeon]|jgi:2,4-dienoyl-CoA reductase-like NADH-dependent reductase (Old Yellow Enzyme family)
MPRITDPITIRGMTVKNRLGFAPCLTSSSDAQGKPTQRTFNAYEVKARGGVGLITYEGTGVNPLGIGGNGSNIGRVENIPDYRKMTDMIHKYGVKVGVQMAEGGIITYYFVKMMGMYMQPIGPSQVDLYETVSAAKLLVPNWKARVEEDNAEMKVLTVDEMKGIQDMFAAGAKNAVEAGFDFVEIHSAHGTLYHSFLSPYLNKRTDQYGGSYENRCRMAVETIGKIREVVGEEIPIFIRISADELVDNGNRIEDTIEIAKILEKGGVDCIDVTQGVIYRTPYGITVPTYIDHGGFIHYSEAIKKNVKIPVIGVGRINSPGMADRFIQQGKADIIYLARQLICDPDTPNKYFEGRSDEIRCCIGCLVGCGSVCVLDAYGGQNYKELTPSTDLKKIVILGAGIAGMEAARIANIRGHDVEIYEKSDKKGGLMPLLGLEYKKYDFVRASGYLEKQLEKAGVSVHLNKELTKEEVANLNPDILVLAAGSEATIPVNLKGKPNVLTQDEGILKSKPIGKNIVIWGLNGYWHGGAETILSFIEEGYNVKAFVGPEAVVGQILPGGRRLWILEYLVDKKIPIYTKAKLLDVTENGVKFLDENGGEKFIEADTLIYCGARISNGKKLQEKFEGVASQIVLLGDCKSPRDIQAALTDAQNFARGLK